MRDNKEKTDRGNNQTKGSSITAPRKIHPGSILCLKHILIFYRICSNALVKRNTIAFHWITSACSVAWETFLGSVNQISRAQQDSPCTKFLNNRPQPQKMGNASQNNQKQPHIFQIKQSIVCVEAFLEGTTENQTAAWNGLKYHIQQSHQWLLNFRGKQLPFTTDSKWRIRCKTNRLIQFILKLRDYPMP